MVSLWLAKPYRSVANKSNKRLITYTIIQCMRTVLKNWSTVMVGENLRLSLSRSKMPTSNLRSELWLARPIYHMHEM
ncbi:hypothetical protein EON65_53945 [archaeon]|nr:MAG: hypothetical protein EON65_53945 [archaeon]